MMKKYLMWVAVLVYFVSLFLPAIIPQYDSSWSKTGEMVYGGGILMAGWLGIFILQFAWYSNVLFMYALIFLYSQDYKRASIFSVLAVILGLQSFFLKTFPNDTSGGGDTVVDHLGIGFYVWELSFAILFLYSYIKYREAKEHTSTVALENATTKTT